MQPTVYKKIRRLYNSNSEETCKENYDYSQIKVLTYYQNLDNLKTVWELPADGILYKEESEIKSKETEDKSIATVELKACNWRKIFTEQGKQFYYHPVLDESKWELPTVESQINVQKEEFSKNEETTELTEEDLYYQLQLQQEEYEKEDLEPEVEVYDKETIIKRFKLLLEETGVSPIDVWDKIKEKIKHESRYLDVDNDKERNKLFNAYCKQLSKTKPINNVPKQDAIEKFKSLLVKNCKPNTDWNIFNRKFFNDPLAKLLNYKERQAIFLEYQNSLL